MLYYLRVWYRNGTVETSFHFTEARAHIHASFNTRVNGRGGKLKHRVTPCMPGQLTRV